jgi:hypothetical protein
MHNVTGTKEDEGKEGSSSTKQGRREDQTTKGLQSHFFPLSNRFSAE